MTDHYLRLPNNEDSNNIELQSISITSDNSNSVYDVDQSNDEPSEDQDPLTKSSMKMAFMNMSNSILGAGIIGQPYATKNCGLAASLFTFVILTVIIDWTIRLIIINCKLSGTKTYQDTAEKCFGKSGKLVILLAQGFFAVGGCIAFCIIIGDTIPHVLQSITPDRWQDSNFILKFMLQRNSLIVLLTCFISFPLSLTDNIANLATSSLFALVNMLTIILIIVIHGFSLLEETLSKFSFKKPFSGYILNGSIFQGVSVISFALVCHHNTSFIYDSLRKPTLDRFTKLTHWSCYISMVCCGLVGVSGALMFKDGTKGNILNNFDENDWVINIARVCFGLNMLTTFPLEIFVVRQVTYDLINLNKHNTHVRISQHDPDDREIDDPESELASDYNRHFVITTVLVFGTMFVSLLTCNLGATLELIGSVSASIMAFIFPCMCYLNLTDYKSKPLSEKWPSYFTIAFGFAVLIISSTQTIVQAIKEGGGGDHCKVG